MHSKGPKGISPKKWGRVTWVMLHGLAHLAIARPSPVRARAARLVVLCMPQLLPCGTCRRNLAEKLASMPAPDAASAARDPRVLAVWVHELHNLTNVDTGKPLVAYADGLDGKLAALSAPRLFEVVRVAARRAKRYIARCLEERKESAWQSQRAAEEYEAAESTYRLFRVLLGVVLGARKNGGVA